MENNNLKNYLYKSLMWGFLLSLARGVLYALAGFPVALILLSGLDRFFEMTRTGREGAWFFLLALGLALILKGFLPFSQFKLETRSRWLSRKKGEDFREDELMLVNQFLSAPQQSSSPSDLRQTYLSRLSERAAELTGREAYSPFPWKKFVTLAAGSCLLLGLVSAFWSGSSRAWNRLLNPFSSSDIDSLVRVEPGNSDVPLGGDADINVTLLVPSLEKPHLRIKSGSSWIRLASQKTSGAAELFSIPHITAPLYYRVEWMGDMGRVYRLQPFQPIQIKSFKVNLIPPSYAGSAEIQQDSPALDVLPGTRVRMEIDLSESLDETRFQFESEPVLLGQKISRHQFSFDFLSLKPGAYHFEGLINSQWRPVGDLYSLRIKEDKSPSITLLSPDQDLIVGDKEEIPLTFEAADDVGLGTVELNYQSESGGLQSKVIATAEPGKRSVFSTWKWDMSLLPISAGSFIRYRLVVKDRNTVSGPGQAATPWMNLEIQNFQKGHEKLEKSLSEWRDEILESLAQANSLQKKLGAEKPDPAAAQAQGKELTASVQDLEAGLRKILSQMESDPMTDSKVWAEHRAMAENLSVMNKELMPETMEKLNSSDVKSAGPGLKDVSAELERMAALSENLTKDQKAADLQQQGDDLNSLGDRLKEALNSSSKTGGKISEADQKKVDAILAEAEKMLEEMAKLIQQTPQDLPEDFVNQAALKQLNFAQPQSMLQKIQEALRNGDLNKALELAQQFQSQVKNLRDQLNKAHEGFQSSQSESQMSTAVSEEQKKLDELIQGQLEVLGQTQKIDTQRRELERKIWEDRFRQLEILQKAVLDKANGLLSQSKMDPQLKADLLSQEPAMMAVLKEFSDRKLEKSPVILDSIVNSLSQSLVAHSSKTVEGLLVVEEIKKEEMAIRDELKKSISKDSVLKPEDKEKLKSLSEKQSGLKSTSSALRQRIQSLSRKSAMLGLPLTRALGEAGEAMDKAAGALGEQDSRGALVFEEEAVQHLLDGQSQMEQAAGQSGGGNSGSGSGSGGRIRVMGKGRGGSSGIHNAPVRLPTVEDYRPPAAFREELLKGLKEKYPQMYEDIIQKYYKRLTE